MNAKKLFLCLVVLGGVLVGPNSSAAFEATEQAAYQLDDTTYLFMIEYEFGFLNADAYLPVSATQNGAERVGKPHISYELTGIAGGTMTGQVAGVVLSDAKVIGGNYHIPEGEREQFTLLVLYRTDGTKLTELPKLQVTSLGTVVDAGPELSYMKVSDKQLKDYQASPGGITGVEVYVQ